ncbi:T6SS effector BTH_I2691 family protein [Aquabacterium sp.]|uniref:T6SS effector BTH_I2691 family protein n=1 Tax=Aquabacterium sp. TaxID=1872578 RepID=UPI002489FB2C|nr:T6SS effector BTH_I2691 family protein [Aquabacterium sp.]MDI1258280.1 hypothetical protein [Aquabacterium sp.]
MQCEFCDKKGLAVLPARPAVAPAGMHAPAVPKDMMAGAADIAINPASYTLRHLRPGFLYTYDEARGKLEAYAVVEGGYFYKLEPNESTPPNLKFSCAPEKCGTVASCVTVPDVKNATNVWFGYSDVQWTEAVRTKHKNDGAYRARHMQCLDVKTWVASKAHHGAVDINEVDKVVAEYALSDAAGKALASSITKFKSKASTAKALKERVPLISTAGGLVMAVADPAAIAADLALLMQNSFDAFSNAKVRKRELAVSNAITNIEQAVREYARSAEESAADKAANDMLGQPDIGMLFSGYREKKLAQVEDVRTVTEAEAKRAGDHEWARYQTKFDFKAAAAWRKDFDAQLQTFDKANIEPLALAHTAWMKSTLMAAKFECTHDASDERVGLVYAKTLHMCIGSTQDKAACFDLYVDWFDGDITKKENLLLRALTLNLDKTASEISKGLGVSLDWRGYPFDALMGSVGKATERAAMGEADALGRLIAAVLGPISKVIGRAYDGKVRAGLVALSLYTQKPFVAVEVTGSKKAFRAMLIRELLKGNGQATNPRKMEQAVANEMRRLELSGEKLEGTDKKRFLLMVDPEQLRGMPEGLPAQERAKWVASRIRTPQQVEELNLSAWRGKIGDPTRNVLKGSIGIVVTMVCALIQYNVAQKLMEDDGKAMAQEKAETHQRLRAGQVALAGTITELVGTGLGKVVVVIPRFGPGLAKAAEWIALGGRVLGLCSALVMAGWDLLQARENYRKGHPGIALAYVGSAILGGLVAAVLWFGWTGIGLILIGLLMVVACIIEYVKNNKLQDWLERCLWGRGSERYKTLEEEMAQLKAANS